MTIKCICLKKANWLQHPLLSRWVSQIESLLIKHIQALFFSFDDTVPIPSKYPWRIFVINSFVNIVKINIYRVAHKTQKYVCFYSFICKTFLLIYYISYPKVLMVYFQSICSLERVQFSGSSLCKTKMNLFLMRPI